MFSRHLMLISGHVQAFHFVISSKRLRPKSFCVWQMFSGFPEGSYFFSKLGSSPMPRCICVKSQMKRWQTEISHLYPQFHNFSINFYGSSCPQLPLINLTFSFSMSFCLSNSLYSFFYMLCKYIWSSFFNFCQSYTPLILRNIPYLDTVCLSTFLSIVLFLVHCSITGVVVCSGRPFTFLLDPKLMRWVC